MKLWKKLNRWYRRRQWIKAYKILRNEYERHRDAGHIITFEAVSEAYVLVRCTGCPNLLP